MSDKKSTQEVMGQVAARLQKAGAPVIPRSFESLTRDWYAYNRKRILAMVGGQESNAALYIAMAFEQVNRIPDLMQCTPDSFFQCLICSMGTSLLPGFMQECTFLPFRENKNNRSLATFVPMYQGLVRLCFNSGFVHKIIANVVWEADEFSYDDGEDVLIHHIFRGPQKDRGQRIGAYSKIKNCYGEWQIKYMTAEQVETIKGRSRGAKSSHSPWNSQYPDDVDQMWIKTPFKRAAKWVSKSPTPRGLQFGRALELDNMSDADLPISPALLSDDIESVKETIILPQPQAQIPEKTETGGGYDEDAASQAGLAKERAEKENAAKQS